MAMAKVIVKRYGDNRTIWLQEGYLCEQAGVSDGYLRKRARTLFFDSVPASCRNRSLLPATGMSWRFTQIDGTYYYDYDAVPDKAPNYYRSQLPTERQLLDYARNPYTEDEYSQKLKEELVDEAVGHVPAQQRKEWLTYYMTDCRKMTFGPEDASRMAEAYAVARYISDMRRGGYKQWGFKRLKDFDVSVCELLKERKYPNFAISNPASLRRKLNEIASAEREGKALDEFVSDKFGNDNSTLVKKTDVVDTETGEIYSLSMHEFVMYGLWNGGGAEHGTLNKQKKVQLYEQYLSEMSRYGYTERVMSYRTFSFHTAKWETRLFRSYGRDGYTLHNNRNRPYVLTQGVKNPMSLWVADGTGTKMVFQYHGLMRTLFRVNIFDVYSQRIIGYCINTRIRQRNVDHEEAWMFREALSMAIETCGGRVANELLSDNGGAFADPQNKEICNLIFPTYRTITPGNSQENQAETLQRLVFNFCRRYSNFVGSRMGNIKDENRTTNFEGLDIRSLPTYEEALQQQNDMVEAWNNNTGADGLTPNQRFFGNGGENLKREDWGYRPAAETVRRALGMRTTVHLAHMRGKMKIESDGDIYYYEIDLAQNAEKINRMTGYQGDAEVTVCHDGKVADLYTDGGALICSCNAVEKAFKATCEADDDTRRGMGKQRKMRDDFDKKVQGSMESIADAKWRMPLSGEITDYGFAVAGKSKVKPEIQDCEEMLLNQEAEQTSELPIRKNKQGEMTPEQQAMNDF